MPDKSTTHSLQAIRTAFNTMQRRYFALLLITGSILISGQYFLQQKLTQIGITYEALNDIQQLYELGSILQPKGLLIAASQQETERQKHIEEFSKQVDIYLTLYTRLRYNSAYHAVFGVSDTVKKRIFSLDKETSLLRNELPIIADTISLDTTFQRIGAILSIQSRMEQELSVFIYGYRQELQEMRQFVQWLSYCMIGFIILVVAGEFLFILLPSRKNIQNLFMQAEDIQQDLASALKTVSETRTRYELLVNQAHDCVYQLDTRGRFVFANNAATKLLGYDNAMLTETFYLDYVHPDYRRGVMVEYLRQTDGETDSEPMLFPIVDSSGKTHWVEQIITKLFDNQMFVGYLGIARDITERKETQESLKELNALNSLVLENTSTAVITTDMNGTITLINNAAEYLLGYEPEEILGTGNILSLQPPEEIAAKKQATAEAFGIHIKSDLDMLFLNAEHYGKYSQRSLLLTKHGNVLPVEMRLRLLKDANDKTKGLLITAVDVSEQQQLEQIKQEFISRVSHEMRTPLHGIMGMIEILRSSPLNDEQRSMLDIAQSKSDVLLTLINDILEYSKFQSGTLEIQRVHADVTMLISNITEVLQHRLFSKNIELELRIPPEMPATLYCDPVRLYQIILNLCDNLTQFTSHGKMYIDFDYIVKPETKDGMYISIYTLGATIDGDVQRKVFTPFVNERDNREKFHPAGFQIGLIRGIVQQMGGVLWMENNPETGSTFQIFLSVERDKSITPHKVGALQPEERGTAEEKNADKQAITTLSTNEAFISAFRQATMQAKTARILLVDDDIDNINLALTFLSKPTNPEYSWTITTAANGKEAVAAFSQQTFDVVLMDIQMPEMDGFEATHAIREIERAEKRRRVPIIAITAHAMINYRDKCLQAGMDDYLSKPVKKKQLQDMVHKWLEHRKTILIADDSEEFRLILQLQFEKLQKYNLLLASNGREAIDLFQEHNVHAIVMDMEMPVLNGYEATKIIRQMPKGRKLPIYAMTAHQGDKEIQRTLDAGCTECFSKIGLETIKEVISTLNAYFEAQITETST